MLYHLSLIRRSACCKHKKTNQVKMPRAHFCVSHEKKTASAREQHTRRRLTNKQKLMKEGRVPYFMVWDWLTG
jgi:hypothetical protein